jgi:outer membrane protein assembly factor BamB
MLIASSVSSGQLLALSESNGSSLRDFGFVTPGWYSPRYVVSTYSASGVGLVFFSTVGSDWYQWSGVTEDGPPFIDGNYLSNGQNVWTCGIPSGPSQYYRQGGALHGTINPYYGLSLIAYYQGDVYAIPFNSGNVTAIQSSSGTIDWQLNLPGKIDTIPTLGNNVLVVGYSDQNQVTGISARTNTTLWNFTTDGPVGASPAYDNGNFFFGTMSGNFYCVTQNGQEAWSAPIGTRIETTPATAFGLVFFGAYNGTLYALDVETGNEAWQVPTEGGLLSPPVVAANGILYQATTSGLLYALNATNGAELWTYPLEAGVTAGPVLDNGCLFLVDSNGKIYAIADSHSVTFSETGLPSGTSWGVTLGTETSFTNTNTKTFSMTNGIYTFNISKLNGYVPKPLSGIATVDGANVSIPVSFIPGWRLPSAPMNASAAGAPNAIVLKWEPPNDNGAPPDFVGSGIEAYNIYRGTASGNEKYYDRTNGTILTYADNSVNAGAIYFYEVTAVNPEGESGFSNEISAQEPVITAPSPPSDLTAVPQDNGIYLQFNQPSSNGGSTITQFVIYRGTQHGSESVHQTLPATQTNYLDTQVAPGQTYYYFVEAVNSAGLSSPSNSMVVVAKKGEASIFDKALNPNIDPNVFFLFWSFVVAIVALVVCILQLREMKKQKASRENPM